MNQWPLTVDIYVHVRAAEVFSQYGLTFIDPHINPPHGSPLNNPPLFSLIIMYLGNALKINYFQAARFLQPFLAFSVVLSVSYVSKKLYGDIAGISAGFLIMSSYLFTRLISPLPETLALIFVPVAVYLFYQSVMTKKYRYALLSSFMFLLVIATHASTTNLLLIIITSITIILGIVKREKVYFISYAYFLSVPIVAGLIGGILLYVVSPTFAHQLLSYAVILIKTSVPYNSPISAAKYIIYLGIVVIFAFIGMLVGAKRRSTKDLFMFIWIVVLVITSVSYLFGVNVYTIRLLVHILLPLSIVGGMGLSYLYLDFKKTDFTSKSIRSIFLIAIFVISSLFAVVTVTESNYQTIPQYNTVQPYGTTDLIIPQLAPPTTADVELANWFNLYGDNKSSIVSNNYNTNNFLVATTHQPVETVSTCTMIIEDGFVPIQLKHRDIGYFVLDKRLVFTNAKENIITDSFIFFNKNYDITSELPANSQVLYENQYYVVYKI